LTVVSDLEEAGCAAVVFAVLCHNPSSDAMNVPQSFKVNALTVNTEHQSYTFGNGARRLFAVLKTYGFRTHSHGVQIGCT
jgi:hypothetical protein